MWTDRRNDGGPDMNIRFSPKNLRFERVLLLQTKQHADRQKRSDENAFGFEKKTKKKQFS